MRAASVKEIKTELGNLHPSQLIELCLQLSKFKKDNKELLTYLLFEADNQAQYIKDVKAFIDEQFLEINRSNLYLTKKTIRKILRNTNKHIKYTGSKQAEVELLMHFCIQMKRLRLPLSSNTALGNIYLNQTLKIRKTLSTLHEDLQLNYEDSLLML
jgi:hypothetical protein